MPRKKMFRKAEPIVAIHTLILAIHEGSWVFYKDRPLHPSFILHMNFATVLGGIKAGVFHQAERLE